MAVTLVHPSVGITAAFQTRPSAAAALTTAEQSRCSCAPAQSCRPGRVLAIGHVSYKSDRRSFEGDIRLLSAAVWSAPRMAAGSGVRQVTVTNKSGGSGAKPVIQFIRGINEQSVPDVRLTRSRDGSNGVASFVFDQPSVFDSSRELGDITGIYMIDYEGILSSVDVSAKFVNGKPAKIEARYVMRNLKEWDRFMRFMERYATDNQLGFVKS